VIRWKPRAWPRPGRALGRLQAAHLGPDVRARREVVMEEWIGEPVVGELLVIEEESSSLSGEPQTLKVHGQEATSAQTST